ncbi:MAG: MgtC/SapB family protein, partial [Acidobacteriaceae bacterium]
MFTFVTPGTALIAPGSPQAPNSHPVPLGRPRIPANPGSGKRPPAGKPIRSRNGHPAGLRTVLLVTLAASVAMIQMDLLLPTSGKNFSSFSVMDVMRLPLGILTGVGFIGAGAIVRRGDIVLGITTAATLWFATAVGLCLGGGQITLGSAAALIGYGVLTALRGLENIIEKYQPATLLVVTADDGVT